MGKRYLDVFRCVFGAMEGLDPMHQLSGFSMGSLPQTAGNLTCLYSRISMCVSRMLEHLECKFRIVEYAAYEGRPHRNFDMPESTVSCR